MGRGSSVAEAHHTVEHRPRARRRGWWALAVCGVVLANCNDIRYLPDTAVRPSSPLLTRLSVVLSPHQLPGGGGVTTAHIETSDGGVVSVPDVPVRLMSSSGQLAQTEITTDSTGHATVSWNVDRTATLTATSGTLTTVTTVTVQAP